MPTFERDVLVPAGHAIIGGIIGAMAIALLSAWGAVSGAWGAGAVLLAGATGGALIAAVIYGWLIVDRRKLLHDIEKATGKDFDGDGQVGPPRLIYVRGTREVQRHKEIEEAERFRLFLQGIYGDRGPTWRAWDGTLTQPQWEDYCGRLLDANLAERKGETSSLTLPSTYRDALRVFAEIL